VYVFYKTGASTCIGDEGGAFVINMGEPDDPREVVRGIASFQNADCTAGKPAVWTSVVYHLDWIENEIMRPPGPVPPGNDGCECECRCYTCPEDDEPLNILMVK
jgi:secreted trypsin-like serine protease